MTWTDEHGVTHAISTYTDVYGTIRVWKYSDALGFGARAWTRCKIRAPPYSKESLAVVDCMACLVKGTT